MEELLKVGGLFEFVDTPEQEFKELTMEFICNFFNNKEVEADDELGMYLFCKFAIKKSILLNEFSKCLGVLVEVMEAEDYAKAPKERPLEFDVEE